MKKFWKEILILTIQLFLFYICGANRYNGHDIITYNWNIYSFSNNI